MEARPAVRPRALSTNGYGRFTDRNGKVLCGQTSDFERDHDACVADEQIRDRCPPQCSFGRVRMIFGVGTTRLKGVAEPFAQCDELGWGLPGP